MTIDRRQIVIGGLGLGAGIAATAGPRPASAYAQTGNAVTDFGVAPDSDGDQTAALQAAIHAAARTGTPLHLPAGRYAVGSLTLPPGTHLQGVPNRTTLANAGENGFLRADGADDLRLEGLTLDGGGRPLAEGEALLRARQCAGLTIRDCRIAASAAHGIALHGCSGRVSDCDISGIFSTGLYSIDADGLDIRHNHVHDCANNGIQVWRTSAAEDGTVVANNRIAHIRTETGGEGQNGNGINVFRAGSVLVLGNRIADCAFTAIRANSASNCQMVANSCARLGEVALYAEFAFEGSIIAHNLVDEAAAGISITNFNDGGRLAIAQGNLIRNLTLRDHYEPRGFGIAVEADTLVTGNVVEGAPSVGISAGWGPHLRDVTVTANTVRRARVGIGVSASAGAGYALVTNNMISDTEEGAIRAMDHTELLGPDLAHASAEAYRNLAVYGNVAL